MIIKKALDFKNNDIIIIKLERNNLDVLARAYANKNDILYKYAENIKEIEGYEDFIIHGTPNCVEYETTTGIWVQLTPQELAETLRMM